MIDWEKHDKKLDEIENRMNKSLDRIFVGVDKLNESTKRFSKTIRWAAGVIIVLWIGFVIECVILFNYLL